MTPDDLRFLRDARSRRDFFRVSGLTVAGGSAVFLAACGDEDEEPAPSSTDAGGGAADVEILTPRSTSRTAPSLRTRREPRC